MEIVGYISVAGLSVADTFSRLLSDRTVNQDSFCEELKQYHA